MVWTESKCCFVRFLSNRINLTVGFDQINKQINKQGSCRLWGGLAFTSGLTVLGPTDLCVCRRHSSRVRAGAAAGVPRTRCAHGQEALTSRLQGSQDPLAPGDRV